MNRHLALLLLLLLVDILASAPVDPKKKEAKKKGEEKEDEESDDLGLEYGRYLQQVVQALEEDKEFAKKLENVSVEDIQSGKIADHLEFVKHNVRTKLDELKRIEVDRLRKLVQEQMERTELGLYRDEDGRLLPSPDGRRWRTIPGHQGGQEGGVGGGGGDFWLGLDRKGVKIPQHIDIDNVHTFEISDLKKLIQAATKDLEALDKKRREEFKKYEMEKEIKYRESLKNMTEEEKKETEKHHEEMIKKHKDHPKVHHPGSKPQLEQVWEEEDHMPRDEFNPKTFFAMHDLNEDGHLDEKEVEALLMPEVRKMYDPKNEEDDPAEMEEEYHRMREHIFNETDKDKDGLISLEEFIKMTQQQDFERDEGWKGLDEQTVYSEAELEEYMRQRHMAMQNQQYYGDPRMYYDVPHVQNQGMPPHINYQVPHPGMQVQHPQYQGSHPQMQPQYQGVNQGMQQPQYQGVNQGMQQPQYQGVNQGMQQPQHYQQQQYHQPAYIPQEQPQQYHAVPPPHQPQFQGIPPQQYQAVHSQQQNNQGAAVGNNPSQQQHYQPKGGIPDSQKHYQQGGVPAQQLQHPPQASISQKHGISSQGQGQPQVQQNIQQQPQPVQQQPNVQPQASVEQGRGAAENQVPPASANEIPVAGKPSMPSGQSSQQHPAKV